jgi:hypothetical protein
MKKVALIVLLLVQVAFSEEPEALVNFKSQLEEAIRTKSTKGIAALTYSEGASRYQLDLAVFRYELNWDENTLVDVTFADVDDPTYRTLVEPDQVVMNGTTYVRNLKPSKLCLIVWKNRTDNKAKYVSPIGIAPDGSYKFILQKRAPEAQQTGPPNP